MPQTLLDWRTIADDREKYAAYLCSPEWGRLRQAVHDRCSSICERCRSNPVDAVHHLTYARKYQEEMSDLQGNCKGCHDFTHGRSTVDPYLEATIDFDSLNGRKMRCSGCGGSHLAFRGCNVSINDMMAQHIQTRWECKNCRASWDLCLVFEDGSFVEVAFHAGKR